MEVPFTAFPATTSGTYTNTFNLSTLSYTAGFTEAMLIAGLNNGTAYANIHTATYPGGEIRGQLAAVTPEPKQPAAVGHGSAGGGGCLAPALAGIGGFLRSCSAGKAKA